MTLDLARRVVLFFTRNYVFCIFFVAFHAYVVTSFTSIIFMNSIFTLVKIKVILFFTFITF